MSEHKNQCTCHCHEEATAPAGFKCRCIKNCIHCHPENFPAVPTTDQEVSLREKFEKELDLGYGDGVGHFSLGSKTKHVADLFERYVRLAVEEAYDNGATEASMVCNEKTIPLAVSEAVKKEREENIAAISARKYIDFGDGTWTCQFETKDGHSSNTTSEFTAKWHNKLIDSLISLIRYREQ